MKCENIAVVQDIIHFLKNEMFVEKMIINKAKPHRGELFIEMIEPMKLSSVGATCCIAVYPLANSLANEFFMSRYFMCLQFFILHCTFLIAACRDMMYSCSLFCTSGFLSS